MKPFIKEYGRLPVYILYLKNTIQKGFIDLDQVFRDLLNHSSRDPIFRGASFVGGLAYDITSRDFLNNIDKYAKSYSRGKMERYVPLYEGIDPVNKSSEIHKDKLSPPESQKTPKPNLKKSIVGFSTHIKARDLREKGKSFEEIRKELKLNHEQMREIFSDYVAAVTHDLDASFKRSDYLRSLYSRKETQK